MWCISKVRISGGFFQPPGGRRPAPPPATPLPAGRAQAAADPASLIISHGGSHDSLAHWRALELSAKPFRHSDRGEPLSSREKFGAGLWMDGTMPVRSKNWVPAPPPTALANPSQKSPTPFSLANPSRKSASQKYLAQKWWNFKSASQRGKRFLLMI